MSDIRRTFPLDLERQWEHRRELVLKRDVYAKQFAMSRVALERLPQGFGEHYLKEECYRMSLSLFGLSHEMATLLPEYSYPDGWWQAVKERFFPSWLLRRWPVRWKRVGGGKLAVDVRALFPELEPMRGQDEMRIYYYVGAPVYTGEKP